MAPLSQSTPSYYQDGLRMISFCPLCETNYNPMEARVLGEKEDGHLLHIRCRKCWNSILALVLVSNAGVSSIGLITDLTYDDVRKFSSRDQTVSTDDVIAVHQLLSDESQDSSDFIDAVLESI
jgi:hypothetical protein